MLVVKTVLSVLRRIGREQPHELLHRDLFVVDTGQDGDDVAGGGRRHGRADRRVGVFSAADRRGGLVTNEAPLDEEVVRRARARRRRIVSLTAVAGTLPAMSRTELVPVFSSVT